MGYDPICMIIMDCNRGAFISSAREAEFGGWSQRGWRKRATKTLDTWGDFRNQTYFLSSRPETPEKMWIKEDAERAWWMAAGSSHHPWCSQSDTDLWWSVGPPPELPYARLARESPGSISQTNIYITTYVNRPQAASPKDKNQKGMQETCINYFWTS